MVKVGEHITLDIIGTTKDYSPSFFEKIVYKIAKKSKVICSPTFFTIISSPDSLLIVPKQIFLLLSNKKLL